MRKIDIKVGIHWNLVSYVFLGLFMLFSYCMITWWYGKAALGVYNIVLSVFMICGHVGVFGLQSAAIYFIPRQSDDRNKLGQCFFSFLTIAIIVSLSLAGLIFLSSGVMGNFIFKSEYVSEGLQMMSPSLVLFSVNKLIGGYINGMGRMRQFAILQSIRYFFIVIYIGFIALMQLEFHFIFYAFLVSEIGVLITGIIFLNKKISFQRPQKSFIITGIKFGAQAMLGNVISDINTRVDIMMLGVLCEDAVVGSYSFVTIIAEGVISILFVFRSNFNPHFADLLFENKIRDLSSLLKDQRKKLSGFFTVLGIFILVGYTVFCRVLLEDSYIASIPCVLIILIGCVVMAPYFVFGNVCTLYGKPFIDTSITLFTILSNGLLNYILISKFEITGAALATCISYIVFSVLTFWAVRKILKSARNNGHEAVEKL